MISEESRQVIRKAKELYERNLKHDLETTQRDKFVAIEPESGDYFVGDTLDDAVKLARNKHPGKLSHTIRVGHRAALHMGVVHFDRPC